MRIVTAAVMASTLAVSSLSHAAEVGSGDNWHPGEELTQRSTQSHMFDGISLTEHQRQQMRDLMQQARHEQPPVNVSELETMHRLVTAENFDENAVRAQAEKMANEQIARQVEMASPQPNVSPVNAGAASGFKRETSTTNGAVARRDAMAKKFIVEAIE